MSTTSPEFLIELNRSQPRRLHAQIEGGLRDAICSGRLAAGVVLPSTRALAADLGVTRGVVVAAYDQLLAEGYLLARHGSGTVVNSAPSAPDRTARAAAPATELTIDFRPSVPDLSLFPRAAWLRATRSALQTLPDADLGYTDPRGLLQLRRAVADYLGRVRGVVADAEQVVICNGFSHGLSLLAAQLLDDGYDTFAVEDPGHDGPREALEAFGIGCVGVAVDSQGIVVDELRRSGARAVLLTPAHQFPTGVVISPERRRRLIDWAHDVDGYVIEDDYDAEYRYDRHPIGSVQGLAPDRVVYAGTLSKSLAPGLRLGWLVLPEQLVEPIAATRRLTDHATSAHPQATLATFLANGDLDRHLRRTRLVYRERRDALAAAIERWIPTAKVGGIAAGLNVFVTLPAGVAELPFVKRAAAEGVGVYPLSRYRVTGRVHARRRSCLATGASRRSGSRRACGGRRGPPSNALALRQRGVAVPELDDRLGGVEVRRHGWVPDRGRSRPVVSLIDHRGAGERFVAEVQLDDDFGEVGAARHKGGSRGRGVGCDAVPGEHLEHRERGLGGVDRHLEQRRRWPGREFAVPWTYITGTGAGSPHEAVRCRR